MGSQIKDPEKVAQRFRKHWQSATDDNNLTLHGFRRFKTTHLLNLRFLEDEIAELDHVIYQAGFSLGLDISSTDQLGLKHGKRDTNVPKIDVTITPDLILKVRDLVKQYDEALIAFNSIMAMETFSLLDDEKQSSRRTDLNLYEIYKTRLVRLDLTTRSRTDPLQRQFHKWLRAFRYWRLSRFQNDTEALVARGRGQQWSYQNTILLATIMWRGIITVVMAIFLIAPLAILSHQESRDVQLVVISLCIFIFALVITTTLKVSNLEMIAVSAAYAAVLSVFMSNVS